MTAARSVDTYLSAYGPMLLLQHAKLLADSGISAHYEAVLASDCWRLLREEVIRHACYRCQACGRGGRQ